MAAIETLSTGAIQALLEQEGRKIAHAAAFIVRAILKDLKKVMRHRHTQALRRALNQFQTWLARSS